MSFGGFFGGGGGGSSSSSSSSSSSNNTSISSPTRSTTSGSGSSATTLQQVQHAVAQQAAIANAKTLMTKVNEACFNHCVPTPGSSLSSGEQKCLSACMEKYLDGWNTVQRTYVARAQREGVMMQNSGPGSMGGAGAGERELF